MDSNASPAAADMSAPRSSWLTRNLTTIVLVGACAAMLGYFLKGADDPWIMIVNILKVVVSLGLVIFIHELGHFLAAKWCDVYVQTFSIGFGPPFLGICSAKWGETTYKIGWVPLGGYVKMVGEGEDNDENADDPRSYKNKKVWQRMIIISAGVVMNMILAVICYIAVFSIHGEERSPGVVGYVGPGGPAWKKGLQPGALMRRIGDKQDPYYDELQRTVMRSGSENPIAFSFDIYEGGKATRIDTEVIPARSSEILAPMLLVRSSSTTTMIDRAAGLKGPTVPGSSAAQVTPGFQFGDRVVGATDPNQPDRVTPLRSDPRRPDEHAFDFFDLERRMQRLMDKPMTFQVERVNGGGTENITVEPAYGRTIGVRMLIGSIEAIREGSPADVGGVRTGEGKTVGDTIQTVEVTRKDGSKLRYSAEPGSGDLPLDPIKLPTQLALWAAGQPTDWSVRLTVLRPESHQDAAKTLTLQWDKSWELLERSPNRGGWPSNTPLSIGALGIAYRVQNTVAGVEPGSAAEEAGVKPGDEVKALAFTTELLGRKRTTPKSDLKEAQWAYYGSTILETEGLTEVELTVNDGQKIALSPRMDKDTPIVDRGIMFEAEKRLTKPQGAAALFRMTGRRFVFDAMKIYENLGGLLTGRLSLRAIGGPFTIAKHSFDLAGRDTFEFILFIAMININLAVVNFLPIPVLDGGHMVFLIYEALRGKPPSDRWRFILTIMGLVVVLGLMILGLGLDFGRYVLDPLKDALGM